MSFHQFNSLAGCLKPSNHIQPLYPLSPQPLQTTEAPTMIYDSIKTKPVRVQPSAAMSSFVDPKIKYYQKKYQADMSIPSYRLGGRKDSILYGVTVVLLAVGFVGNMIDILKPQK